MQNSASVNNSVQATTIKHALFLLGDLKLCSIILSILVLLYIVADTMLIFYRHEPRPGKPDFLLQHNNNNLSIWI